MSASGHASQGKAHHAESSSHQTHPEQRKEGSSQLHFATPAYSSVLASSAAKPWIPLSQAANDPVFMLPPPFAPFGANRCPRPLAPFGSSLDRSQRDLLNYREARETSPPGAPVIKQEEFTLPQRITLFRDSFDEEGSNSSESTIQIPPHRHSTFDQDDNQCPLSPLYSDTTSEGVSADPNGMWERQHALFENLERLCTNAAKYYSHNERHQRWSTSRRTSSPTSHRHHPYARSTTHSYRPHIPHSYQTHTSTLLEYISRISTTLWTTALTCPTPSHFAELQAVHRMGNLYSWAETVILAVSNRGILSDEEVFRVVVSARDLVVWCLHEVGKTQIERLWKEWVAGREEGEIFE
ncbi:MAG: hypothetical protein M1812_000399 [Candelaria pacifica]|nr:MAG: hypothetical protein M1812_000399 [Candelaria pacifica]